MKHIYTNLIGALLIMSTPLYPKSAAVQPVSVEEPTASGAWQALGRGYEQFREKYQRKDASVLQSLAAGQSPEAIVFACSDSRVDPAVIFQKSLGNFFIVRNVANIVPAYDTDCNYAEKAALQYAIEVLNINHIVIIGHSGCGGLKYLLEAHPTKKGDLINPWVQNVKPTKEQATMSVNDYAKEAVKKSREHCLTYPWIAKKVATGELAIHLWYFDIGTVQMYAYSETDDAYHPLDSAQSLMEQFSIRKPVRNKSKKSK